MSTIKDPTVITGDVSNNTVPELHARVREVADRVHEHVLSLETVKHAFHISSDDQNDQTVPDFVVTLRPPHSNDQNDQVVPRTSQDDCGNQVVPRISHDDCDDRDDQVVPRTFHITG
ncbi:MAG: hypothetical protein OXF02_05205 [Simkaniaceae bacterium]|nr:hypothetical protein [Simkaniaceae bacterium]